MSTLPEESQLLKKRNRIKKLTPKVHRISHESGRSAKNLYRLIVEKAKKKGN